MCRRSAAAPLWLVAPTRRSRTLSQPRAPSTSGRHRTTAGLARQASFGFGRRAFRALPRDLPPAVPAIGNPDRVIRELR
jgi:hypothetical protein